MEPPLILDLSDPKWELFAGIIKIFEVRKTRKIISRCGIKPLGKAVHILKIVFLSMFFSCEVAYIVDELKNRKQLRQFLNIEEIPDADEIYRFLSEFDPDQFMEMTLKILNSICKGRGRRRTTIIIDSTDVCVDINWFRNTYKKSDLEDRDFKWAFSSSKGHYLGFKLILAIDYPSLKPLGFLLYSGSPNDSTLFDHIINELSRRRVMRKGDILVLDKGFYAYYHYTDGLVKYGILPLIFPRKNFKLGKVLNGIVPPLEFYLDKPNRIQNKLLFLKKLVSDFKETISNWKSFKYIRSFIEDVFKIKKNALSLDRLHKYTSRSVKKTCSLAVLLIGILVSMGFREKGTLQKLAEW